MFERLNQKIDRNKPLIYAVALGTMAVGTLVIAKGGRTKQLEMYSKYLEGVSASFVENNGKITEAILKGISEISK